MTDNWDRHDRARHRTTFDAGDVDSSESRNADRAASAAPAHAGRRVPADGRHDRARDRRGEARRRGRRDRPGAAWCSCPGSTAAYAQGRHHRPDRERGRAAQRHPRAGDPRRRPRPVSAPARSATKVRCTWRSSRSTTRSRPRAPGSWRKEYRAVVETILEHRGARRIGDILAGVDTPGQLADMAAYAPDLELEQRVELLETIDVEARLELALSWARETLADLELKDRIRTEVTDGHRPAAARDVAAAPDGRHPQGAGRERRRRGRGVPRPCRTSSSCPTRCAPRSTRSSTSSSAWARRIPSRRGSATGSTRCSTCRGAPT